MSWEGVEVHLTDIIHKVEKIQTVELSAPAAGSAVHPERILRLAPRQDYLEIGLCVVLGRAAAMTKREGIIAIVQSAAFLSNVKC